jgi:hypothetical protein
VSLLAALEAISLLLLSFTLPRGQSSNDGVEVNPANMHSVRPHSSNGHDLLTWPKKPLKLTDNNTLSIPVDFSLPYYEATCADVGDNICVYPFAVPTILCNCQFPTFATHAHVTSRVDRVWVAQAYICPRSKHLRQCVTSKKTKWNPPLANVRRPHPFEESILWNMYHPGFNDSLVFQIHHPYSSGVNFHASFTHPQIRPRAFNTASTPPNAPNKSKKLGLRGSLNDMDFCMNACAMFACGAHDDE